MTTIKDEQGNEKYFMPEIMVKILSRIKEKTHNEDDEAWGILWGAKGSGKSVLAQHLGYINDHTLHKNYDGIKRICFTKKEFEDAVRASKKQTVIGDEGISLFFSRGCMTREGRKIAVLSDQIRQKNLFILICIPKILNLDKFLLEEDNLVFIGRVWKSMKIINGKKVTTKGNCHIYINNKQRKNATAMIKFLQAKKNNPGKFVKIPYPQITIPGNAVTKKPWYPVGEAEYRHKKDAILDGEDKEKAEEAIQDKQRKYTRAGLINHERINLWLIKGLSNPQIAKLEGCSLRTVEADRKKFKESHKTVLNITKTLGKQGFEAVTG